MNFISLFLLLFAALPTVPTQLPFTVEACEDVSSQFPGAPRVQSFAFGQWQGRWVFIGGRIAGYHSVGGGAAEFLEKDANRDVWVVDTTVTPAKTYSAPVAQLPVTFMPVRDQWASAGLLYVQDGAKLYISGGYGRDHEGKWVTFPVISQVDLPQLIEGVMQGKVPAASIMFTSSPLVQSAGGELIKLSGNDFYLVMGHVFTGTYTAFEGQGEKSHDSVSQVYLNEIRQLKIECGAKTGLTVRLVQAFKDDVEFHRRDLNATEFLSPQGVGLAVYGGVFTPETQLSYSKPIYLMPNQPPLADTSFEQKMNAYNCPRLPIYGKASQTMHTTFFGGISRYSWNSSTSAFVENPRVGNKSASTYLDGMQWSDQISTISKVMAGGNEKTMETVQPNALPAFLGAEAVFIALPDIARAQPSSAILDLDALPRGKTLVGYIYGGIRAFPYQFPYNKGAALYNSGAAPSKVSEMILKVFVTVQR
jgi:hypothetical protein